jgi:hypothetical protein
LAKVRNRKGERENALTCYRRAWHGATSAGSLAGMVYVAADLVRSLVGVGEYTEAEAVAKELLRQYDAADAPYGTFERAVATTCFTLADLSLAKGAVQAAADWYVEAVLCTQRAVPHVIHGIIQNLRRQPESPSTSVLRLLERELKAHRAMAADLNALVALLEGREEVD